MAYDYGQAQQERPYAGLAAQRPSPRGQPTSPPFQQPPPPQRQYGGPSRSLDYQSNGYAYDGYNQEPYQAQDYGQDYGQEAYPGAEYDSYAYPEEETRGSGPDPRQHPHNRREHHGPQDPYRNRAPTRGYGEAQSRARGGPGRGTAPNAYPPQHRGGGGRSQHDFAPPPQLPYAEDGRPSSSKGSHSAGRPSFDQDPNGLASPMSHMSMEDPRRGAPRGRGPDRHANGGPPQPGGYPRGPPARGRGRGQGSQGYFNPQPGRRGGQPQGRDYPPYDDGPAPMDPHAGQHEFGMPGRSQTMPMQMQAANPMPPPPQRTGTMPFEPPPNLQSGMARPSTATGHRSPPRRFYAGNQHVPQQGAHRDFDDRDYGQPANGGYDDGFDAYYGNPRAQSAEYPPQAGIGQGLPSPDPYDSYASQRPMQQGRAAEYGQPQPGAHQTAQLNHAKSQPSLRQPQSAVIELAGDAPDMPAIPPAHTIPQHGWDQGYGGPQPGQAQHVTRPPTAPPGPPTMGPPDHARPRTAAPAGPDRGMPASSSHPAPVRPGLMSHSMVNVSERPPPIRNYGGIPQANSAPVSYSAPVQQPPQPQSQPQPRPGQAGPPVKDKEPPITAAELEQLRMTIKNNPNDQASALRLAKKLVEAAEVLAPNLPDPKARLRAKERYVFDAHKVLKKLASGQNGEAMFFLADCIGRGVFGNEPDNKEAFTLYNSAAKLGHAAAAYRTAVCCEIGHEEGGGTRRDPLKAMQWYKRAAVLGDPPGMYKMGMILLKGLLGQARNPREAVGWLKRAADLADAENPHALHELGLLYESAQPNDAIVRDERYALSLFQTAADLGYKFSQFRLGCTFEYGLMGCPIDPRQSIRWYSQAAQQEEHQSELALSGWYLTGSEGVLGQSDTEAYLWARKAAMAGLAKAEYAMGYFTEVGIGVPTNLEDAKRWYWRAAAQDFPKARERLEDLKRTGRGGAPRPRERISRSRIERQQEGECSVM